MRLYRSQVRKISEEIVRTLTSAGDIEVLQDNREEAILDVTSVLEQYLEIERKIDHEAKEIQEKRGLDRKSFHRIKADLAKRRAFGVGEEMLDYLTNQIIESFLKSSHVEEVFAEDHTMRKKMADIFRKHMNLDEQLDQEVRRRLRNLQEGSATWEIEYARLMTEAKRARGME